MNFIANNQYLCKNFITFMKFFFSHLLVLFIISVNAQENSSVVDTVYSNQNGKGLFTIEQDQPIKSNIKISIAENCKNEYAKKHKKIVITDNDIKKVSSADKCSITPKIMGYKIQIFYTKSRAEADKIEKEFNAKFSDFSSEIKYLQPDFKVLVGDYLSKNSANRDFTRLRRTYPSSFLIQFPVRCRTAK
jgi:hypothetical protein